MLVVLPKIQDAKKIRDLLTFHGFDQAVALNKGAIALNEANRHNSGLIISGCKLPDMHYSELLENLPNNYELLLIGSAQTISQVDGSIMSLTMPFKLHDLLNTVRVMMSQVEHQAKKAKKRKEKPQRSEREENYIKNAKLLLMDRNHLSEEEAHRYLQKCSMDNGISMVETAQMLLTLIYDET